MKPHPQLPKVSLFLAQSLDGYIARADGGLDWLDRANRGVPPGEDCGFAEFFASTDVLVLGRKSFEKVLEFPAWPYGARPVVVVSGQGGALPVPESLRASVRVFSDEPGAVMRRLGEEAWRGGLARRGSSISISMGGGSLGVFFAKVWSMK